MTNVSSILLKLLIVFFPLAVYQAQILGVPVSVDRLILLVALPVAIFTTIKSVHKIGFEALFYVLFITYAVLVSILYGTNFSSYGAMLFVSLIYFFISKTLWSSSHMSIADLKNTLYLVIILLAGFAFFTINTFLTTSKPPLTLPFEAILPFVSSEGIHVLEQGGFGLGVLTRVSLPFARPQDFGMTCAVLFLLLLSPKINSSKILLFTLFICISLSASRSAIFPLIVSGTVFYILQFGWSRFLQRCTNILLGIICLAGILSFSFPVIIETILMVLDSLSRLTNVLSGESSELHLSVRSAAFTYIFDSPFQVIFGSGVGSFQEKSGVSSAHSTYVTLFHDVGLIGLFFFLLPLLLLLKKSFEFRKSRPENVAIILYIIMAHVLYEVPNQLIFWIVIGLLSSQMRREIRKSGI